LISQLALLEALSGQQSKQMKKEEIDQLPVNEYKSQEQDQTSCVVCLEDIAPGEKILTLPCKHIFH